MRYAVQTSEGYVVLSAARRGYHVTPHIANAYQCSLETAQAILGRIPWAKGRVVPVPEGSELRTTTRREGDAPGG